MSTSTLWQIIEQREEHNNLKHFRLKKLGLIKVKEVTFLYVFVTHV